MFKPRGFFETAKTSVRIARFWNSENGPTRTHFELDSEIFLRHVYYPFWVEQMVSILSILGGTKGNLISGGPGPGKSAGTDKDPLRMGWGGVESVEDQDPPPLRKRAAERLCFIQRFFVPSGL